MTSFSILVAQAPSLFGNPIVMLVLMMIMFYFLLIRPQKKQRQEQEKMQSELKKGDKIVTIGGMHSVIHQVTDSKIILKLGEGVFVPFNKSAIQSIEKASKETKKEAIEAEVEVVKE